MWNHHTTNTTPLPAPTGLPPRGTAIHIAAPAGRGLILQKQARISRKQQCVGGKYWEQPAIRRSANTLHGIGTAHAIPLFTMTKTLNKPNTAEDAINALIESVTGADTKGAAIAPNRRTTASVRADIRRVAGCLAIGYQMGKSSVISRWTREIDALERELDWMRYGRTDVR